MGMTICVVQCQRCQIFFNKQDIFIDLKKSILLIKYEVEKLNSRQSEWKELPRVGHRTQLKTKKVNFLVFQKFYLHFAVFLLKFIKTYILMNFIQYYKGYL